MTIRNWKLLNSSRSSYKWINKARPSLSVTITPWEGSSRDSLDITVQVEETVLADVTTSDMDILDDEPTLQDLLDDIEDITSKFMKSFEKVLTWYDKYGEEQTTLLLALYNDNDLNTMRREYKSIPKKFDSLFY